MGLGVVTTVLHRVDVFGSDHEGFIDLVKPGPGDEHLTVVFRGHFSPCTNRNVRSIGLAIPHVRTAPTNVGCVPAAYLHIDCARGRYDAGLVAVNLADIGFARAELDDVEIDQRRD